MTLPQRGSSGTHGNPLSWDFGCVKACSGLQQADFPRLWSSARRSYIFGPHGVDCQLFGSSGSNPEVEEFRSLLARHGTNPLIQPTMSAAATVVHPRPSRKTQIFPEIGPDPCNSRTTPTRGAALICAVYRSGPWGRAS